MQKQIGRFSRRRFLWGGLGALCAGCNSPGWSFHPADEPLLVCTTNIVADLVRQVAGEVARVVSLMGPGVDPHLYRPSPGDVAQLSWAAGVFYNGLHLEGKMAQLLEHLAQERPVMSLGQWLRRTCPGELIRVGPQEYDPHVWFDVRLWSRTVPGVVEQLQRLFPQHSSTLRQRGEQLIRRLEHLDRYCRRRLSQVPAQRRVLITAHDAFAYFGRAYEVEVLGIQGISTDAEPALADINRLVELIVRRGIPAIFVESSVPERNVHAIVAGCQARGHSLRIGGELYSDSLGPPGSGAETYEGMVRHNVQTIAEALK